MMMYTVYWLLTPSQQYEENSWVPDFGCRVGKGIANPVGEQFIRRVEKALQELGYKTYGHGSGREGAHIDVKLFLHQPMAQFLSAARQVIGWPVWVRESSGDELT
jgi:hypothetical protein